MSTLITFYYMMAVLYCEGFRFEVGKFFIFVLTLFLTTMSASAVCFIAGATFTSFAVANAISVFVFVLMLVSKLESSYLRLYYSAL